jgi:hypothetical protein
MTRIIPLTRGQVALVSDHRFEELNQYKWFAFFSADVNGFYAVRDEWVNGKGKRIYMHRQIMSTPKGAYCDHINLDTLDNRDENLRNCTNSQNCANRLKQKNNTSGYKGVFKNGNHWMARLKKNRKPIYIGTYLTREEAARAYDEKASEIFGEFARLNFSEEDTE